MRLLGRTGRGVRVEPLKVHLLIACADPADTAQLYGRLCAALSAGLPLLERAVRIKDQDIRLFPDFMGDRMDCIADVGVSLRPWIPVWAGLPDRLLLAAEGRAAAAEAEAHPGDGDEGHAVRGLDGLADDGVGVRHLPHLCHALLHHFAEAFPGLCPWRCPP